MRMNSKIDAKLQQQAAAKEQAEKDAIKKIADATMAGIKAVRRPQENFTPKPRNKMKLPQLIKLIN